MKTLVSFLILFFIGTASASTGRIGQYDYIEGQATVPNFITNASAQKVVGSFKPFADGGTAIPVNLTGGTPNTTCTRSASTPLRGDGSFLMTVTTGASRQGEGCVFDPISIPPAYQGAQHIFTFPFSITGSIVSGDVIPYCYDITNSALLAPTFVANPLLGLSGQMLATFQVGFNPTPTSPLSMRCGLYIARTSTGALTIKANDVRFYPTQAVTGMAGSDWKSYTPTFSAGLGTPTNVNMFYRQNGDSIQIKGSFNAGTTAASIGTISLPPGISIDTTKINNVAYAQSFGRGWRKSGSQTNDLTSGPNGIDWVFVYNGSTNLVQVSRQILSNGLYSSENMSTILASGEGVEIEMLTIPGATLSSNVTMAQSSTYRISSYLANGARVTGSAPTALGQYRSYLRNANVSGTTETNGAPSTAPSASNGVMLWAGPAFTSADASNQPSKYDIFVGKNKNITPVFYSGTGFSSPVDTRPFVVSTSSTVGEPWSYDPSTGIFSVYPLYYSGNETTRNAGTQGIGSTVAGPIYFDVIVSENALAVGVQAPRSEVFCTSPSGYGSTNTDVRYFTTCTSKGNDITAATDAVNGTAVTINSDGVYAITYDGDVKSASAFYPAVTVDSTHLTSGTLPTTEIVVNSNTSGAGVWSPPITTTINLKAGQVIRAQTVAAQFADGTGTNIHIRVAKVSN